MSSTAFGSLPLLVLVAAGVLGCSGEQEQQKWSVPLAVRSQSGLSLAVSVPHDSITLASEAVYLEYHIVNGTKPSRFDNNPGLFEVRVESDEGRAVEPVFITAPLLRSMGSTQIRLPARSSLSQVINLKCIQDAAGYGGDPLDPDECLGFYEFDQPGNYRIILMYTGPSLDHPENEGTGAANVQGSAIQNEAPNLQLADTATLIVAG